MQGIEKVVTIGHPDLSVIAHTTTYTGLRPVLRYTQPVGTQGLIYNPIQFVLKLFQVGGAEFSQNTRVLLAKQAAGERAPQFVGDFSYSDFARLAEAEQTNSKHRDSVVKRLWLALPYLSLREGDRFEIWLDGAGQFDSASASNRLRFSVDELN